MDIYNLFLDCPQEEKQRIINLLDRMYHQKVSKDLKGDHSEALEELLLFAKQLNCKSAFQKPSKKKHDRLSV